jgi:adenylate cyclase
VVRNCLTSFYSKNRFQITNAGGMLYQFVGDAAIALFGLPEPDDGHDHLQSALNCALALLEIGESVSSEWQRQIDRVQSGSGVHIGVAIGDLQLMPLHPFSRTQMGVVGEAINMTARLHRGTKTGEIVVTNTFFQQLEPEVQAGFDELGLFEAKNLGTIRAWQANLGKLRRPGAG